MSAAPWHEREALSSVQNRETQAATADPLGGSDLHLSTASNAPHRHVSRSGALDRDGGMNRARMGPAADPPD